MRVDQAKSIHMRDLLSALGYEPSRQMKNEWWYNSPLRSEAEASFKVSADGRAWYDFGAGIGGNILKFVCVYYGLSDNDVSGALRKLDALHIVRSTSMGDPSAPSPQSSLWEDAHQRDLNVINARRDAKRASGGLDYQKGEDNALSVTRIIPVQSWALIQYLNERGIDKETAMPWVQEMHYKRGGKPFFSLAFPSDSGGYELRSRNFKSAHGKKDMSLLNVGNREGEGIAVFEGFFDFLSWMQHAGQKRPDMPVMVLNSVALRKRAVEVIQRMENIQTVHLYADQDANGKALVTYMREKLEGIKLIDESSLYASFHDYNEFLAQNRQAACIA